MFTNGHIREAMLLKKKVKQLLWYSNLCSGHFNKLNAKSITNHDWKGGLNGLIVLLLMV